MSKLHRKNKKRRKKLDFEPEEKKEPLFAKLQKLVKPKKQAPVTFNVGIAIILFFVFLGLAVIIVPVQPMLLLLFLPTLYILIRYIKLSRDSYGKDMLK